MCVCSTCADAYLYHARESVISLNSNSDLTTVSSSDDRRQDETDGLDRTGLDTQIIYTHTFTETEWAETYTCSILVGPISSCRQVLGRHFMSSDRRKPIDLWPLTIWAANKKNAGMLYKMLVKRKRSFFFLGFFKYIWSFWIWFQQHVSSFNHTKLEF